MIPNDGDGRRATFPFPTWQLGFDFSLPFGSLPGKICPPPPGPGPPGPGKGTCADLSPGTRRRARRARAACSSVSPDCPIPNDSEATTLRSSCLSLAPQARTASASATSFDHSRISAPEKRPPFSLASAAGRQPQRWRWPSASSEMVAQATPASVAQLCAYESAHEFANFRVLDGNDWRRSRPR